MRALAFVIALAGLLAGCATLESPQREHLVSADAQARDCAAWFAALDRVVDGYGVRDGSAHRVAGFPYLRADRFIASFRTEQLVDAQLRAWVARLGILDATARRNETRNLPASALADLGVTQRDAALERSAACSDTLMQRDLAAARTRALLAARAAVPDDYSTWQRVAGFYAVMRIPFFAGVSRWQDGTQAQLRQAPVDAPDEAVRYVPAERAPSAARMRDMLSGLELDALGIPRVDEAQQRMLFAGHAPVFAVETSGSHDLPGALHWPAADAPTPAVDIASPVVYHRLAHTRWGGRVRLQLVYTLWFPQRPREGALDLLGGRLDGVVWRVTLDDDGTALIYDTIHACGCYQMFFPAAGVVARPPPAGNIEWAFVPVTLPAHSADRRVLVRLASGTHYVPQISSIDAGEAVDESKFRTGLFC